jgi:hypothetical protein
VSTLAKSSSAEEEESSEAVVRLTKEEDSSTAGGMVSSLRAALGTAMKRRQKYALLLAPTPVMTWTYISFYAVITGSVGHSRTLYNMTVGGVQVMCLRSWKGLNMIVGA